MSDEVGEDTVLTDRAYLAAVDADGGVALLGGEGLCPRRRRGRHRRGVVVAMLARPRRRLTTWMSAPRRSRLVG